jgi:hypothetical protein
MTKLKNIKTNSVKEYNAVVNDYLSIYTGTIEEIQKIGEDPNTPFVKRKFIEFLTSESEKTAFDAISWLHRVVTGENVEIDVTKEIIKHKTGTFDLSEEQNKIYNTLVKENPDYLPGDDYLLKMLAINIDYYNQLSESIDIKGFRMNFKSGAAQIRPEVTALRDSTNNIQSIIKELCLNTASKAKLRLDIKSVSKSDPLDSI